MTSEEALSAKQQEYLEGFRQQKERFNQRCLELTPLWETRMQEVLDAPRPKDAPPVTQAQAGERLYQNSVTDLARLEAELDKVQARGSNIITAASILLASAIWLVNFNPAGASKPSMTGDKTFFIACILFFGGVSLAAAVVPLLPPIRRAWLEPYLDRVYITLLAYDDFTGWALNTWIAMRRTPVITKYKKAHTVACVALILAAILEVPAFVWAMT